MKECKVIKITLKNGLTQHGRYAEWQADEWDDYCYDGKAFIVKKNGEWVGIYNMDSIISVIVK